MVRTLLIPIVLAYLALLAFAWFGADSQIFFPPPSSYTVDSVGAVLVPVEEGVAVAVLHLPHPDAELTILFSHGNAEDLGHALPFLERLRESGFSVLAYDYRGYGASTGVRPTVDGTYRDIAAVYRHATETLEIEPSSIVLFGRSVGSGPSTQLATEQAVGGLILESAFTSAFVVMTRVPIVPFDRYPNRRNLERIDLPVLLIHGTDDGIIPFSHSVSLRDAAAGSVTHVAIEGAGHNDVASVGGEAYWLALETFQQELIASRSR